MFINSFYLRSIFLSHSLINTISRQAKLKIIISSLACGILLLGTTYWACSRFWCSRRVCQEPSSKGHLPTPSAKKETQDLKNEEVLEEEEKKTKDRDAPHSPDIKGKKGTDLKNEKILETQRKEVERIDSLSQPVDAKISICITSSMDVGWIGNDPDRIPNIKNFKLEDKSPLPLQKDDVLLHLHCFNFPSEMKLPHTTYLPAALFANKKEGDTIRVYYQDKLIEFYLHQTEHHTNYYQDGTFETALDLAKHAAQFFDHPSFDHYEKYEWYTAEGGTVYKPVSPAGNNPVFQLNAVSTDQFRPLKGATDETTILQELRMDFLRHEEGDYFITDLPGFSDSSADLDGIEFILNDKVLAIHALRIPMDLGDSIKSAREKARLPEEQEDNEQEFTPYHPQTLQRECPNEYIKGLKWRRIYEDLTLEQMQTKLENGKLVLKDGQFQIFFPTKRSGSFD